MHGARNFARPQWVADHTRALQKHPEGVHAKRGRPQLRIYDHGFTGTQCDGLRECRVSDARETQRDGSGRDPAEPVPTRYLGKYPEGGPDDLHRGTREGQAVVLGGDYTLHRGGTTLGYQWGTKEKRRTVRGKGEETPQLHRNTLSIPFKVPLFEGRLLGSVWVWSFPAGCVDSPVMR